MFATAVYFLSMGTPGLAADFCAVEKQVCAFSKFVFKLEIGGRIGSAVYVGPKIVATNRHIVLGDDLARISDENGHSYLARVIPNDQREDLVLLEAVDLDRGPLPWRSQAASRGETVYIIGYDQTANSIKVFPRGTVILPPIANKPLSRIQHVVKAATGSSGAALVAADGLLIGIATSGDDLRGDAIPVGRVGHLDARSSEQHRVVHRAIGSDYQTCLEILRRMPKRRARLARRAVDYLVRTCSKTQNTHLLNDVGQVLGRAGHMNAGKNIFSQALELDPYALNNRIGLVVTLFLSGGTEETIPHLKWLVELLPRDKKVLRLAVQAGRRGGHIKFARDALQKLEDLDPALAVPLRQYFAR
ncbi:MAG: trypsin-like peptidase domain-containing protein [Candidatus Latescibacterota bacterium]